MARKKEYGRLTVKQFVNLHKQKAAQKTAEHYYSNTPAALKAKATSRKKENEKNKAWNEYKKNRRN